MPTPIVIVLDPGHGGNAAVGGSSPNNATGPNGLLEKDLTLDIAQRVARSLAGSARVILTRTGDTNLSLAARAEVARANNALLFLSIHLNGWPDARVDGTEVYVARAAGDASAGFAQRVLSRLLAVTNVSNRGVKRADFGVLLPARHAAGTAVCLAEIAFLTNRTQAQRLEADAYRAEIAAALEDAVRQYLPSQHFLHHDATRPENRIPPPVPFGLSAGPDDEWSDEPAYEPSLASSLAYEPSYASPSAFEPSYASALAADALDAADALAVAVGAAADPLDTPPALSLDSRIRFVLGDSVGRGGANRPEDIEALKERLVELGFNWLSVNRTLDAETRRAINLVQSIVGGNPDDPVAGDELVSVPGRTYRWLQAANAPRWQLMPAGSPAEGFNNVELADTRDQHDYGTKWMADTLRAAGAHYRDNYLHTHAGAALLTINDVSLPRGGDTRDHGGHERGMACDLRLPRTDGTAPGSTTFGHPRYDQAATRAMLQAIRAQPLFSHIFFNDPVLVREGLCRKTSATDHVHDDHIHFAVRPQAQGGIELVDVRPGVEVAAARRAAAPALAAWAQGYDTLSQTPCGCANCSTSEESASSALQAQPACRNTARIAAGEVNDNCNLLLIPPSGTPGLAHGRVTPNLFLRWNDIPAGACQVDVVVHFHGYASRRYLDSLRPPVPVSQMNVTHKTPFSGLDFVNPAARTSPPVRQGRPTLFILPLGKYVGSDTQYVFPFFTSASNRDGLRLLIDYSLRLLARRHNLPEETFSQRRLILTAHSGGGAALAQVLEHRVSSTDRRRRYNVHEVQLFDAVYSGESSIISWARERIAADAGQTAARMPTGGGALRILYRECSMRDWSYKQRERQCGLSETETHSRNIQTALDRAIPRGSFLRDWYRVEQVSVSHNDIPAAYGYQLLDNAGATLTPAAVTPARAPLCCPQWPNCSRPSTCSGMPRQPAAVGHAAGLEYDDAGFGY
jgi:N-acetylmuramoyl-L-alanine amidase